MTNSNNKLTDKLTKQIAKGAGIAFIGKFVGRFIVLFLHILLARLLNPATYGLYALGLCIINIVRPFGNLGLNRGLLHFCSIYKGQNDNQRIKGTLILVIFNSLISGILLAMLIFFSSDVISNRVFQKPHLSVILKLFSFAIPFQILIQISLSFTQSFRRIDYQQVIGNAFRPVINISLFILLFLIGYKLNGAIYAYIISRIFTSFLGVYLIWKLFPDIFSKLKPILHQYKKLITYSLPMVFVNITYLIILNTDRIMLGYLGTAKDVGIYSASANIAIQISFIHSALLAIFLPIISDINNKCYFDEVKKMFNLVKRWSSYGAFLIALPIIFFPQNIMTIFGKEFILGWIALLILSFAHIIGASFGSTGALLQMSGRQNIEFVNAFISIIVNIVLNYILIPKYGFIGASMSTVFSALLLNTIQAIEIRIIFGFHPFDKKHCKYLILVFFAYGIAIFKAISLTQTHGIILFLLILVLFFSYIYRNRTSSERIVYMALKSKFKNFKNKEKYS